MRIDTVLGALFLIAPLAFLNAEIATADDTIVINDSSCQKISVDESVSSARVRASDAAAYKAVEALPIIAEYRRQFDPQTFSAGIYKLVDNHLLQLNVNTIKQNPEEICVEITAELPISAIKESFFNQSTPDSSASDTPSADSSFTIDLPPKPNIVVNQDIAYESYTPAIEKSAEVVTVTPKVKKAVSRPDNTTVFVERTEFFDGNSTSKFFEYLKKDLEQREGITATDISDNPAYILKTKVLKAKVDRINSSTNRLQVVVSLSLTETQSMENFTEHQNRFVLFNTSEDAQKTASALTKKLLSAGVLKLISHIKTKYDQSADGSILTPHN